MGEEGGKDDSFLGYSPEDWGKTAREEIGIAQSRFPLTHGYNLESLLVLPNGKLGELCLRNPIISRVVFPKDQFWGAVDNEKSRRWLKKWRGRVPFLSAAEEFELSLFTDGQELICGISRGPDGVEKKVIRRLRAAQEIEEEKLKERIEKLRGLIPSMEWFLDENKVLVLVDFIEGREPTDEEIIVFKKNLRERGFKPENFDLNKGNLRVDREGNIFLVDLEDIILA